MLYNIFPIHERSGDYLKAKELAVIGAGASGICAALEAHRTNPAISITVFERLPKAAKKILATGNGRCNFTNENLAPYHFYCETLFLRKILTSSYADTENFFRSLGILPYREDGRIYPRSQQAASVREALTDKLDEYSITTKIDTPVHEMTKTEKGFVINNELFDAVIVAGGGKSSPVHGSDGSCYKLLEALGHSKTPLYPALCGLTTNDKGLNILKGVRAECKAELYSENRLLGEESGEVQFTDKGISGIPVMNLSHLCKNKKQLRLKLDLCEEFSINELTEHLMLVKKESPDKLFENALSGIVNSKLGYTVINKARIKPQTKIRHATAQDIALVCTILKSFEIEITGTRGFDNAQITCGGIKTDEVSPETMMSKITDGLFICGEILDIHGDCGGYNLHLAWTTGRIAGSSAGEYLK